MALGVGDGLAEHVVVAREQLHRDALSRRRVGQAADEDVEAVGAGQGGEAEVGDDEPLGRGRLPVLAGRAVGDAGGEGVEAGRQAGDDIAHRQRRRDVPVLLPGELTRPFPDRLAERVTEPGRLGAGQRRAEVAVAEDGRDVAGADPVELQVGRRGIDRDDGQRGLGTLRQDVGPPREAHGRRAVANVDLLPDRGPEPLAAGGGEAGTQGHLVAAAVGEAVDAERSVAGLDREAAGVEADEVGIVDAGAGERLGEGEAGARARRLEVDLAVGDAEAVEALGAGDGGGDRRTGGEALGEAEGVERGPALSRRLEGDAGQTGALAGLGVAAGAEVAVDARRDREVAEGLALGPVLDLGRGGEGGERGPGRRGVGAVDLGGEAGALGGDRRFGDRVRGREADRQRRLAGGGEAFRRQEGERRRAGGAPAATAGGCGATTAESAAGKAVRAPSSVFRKQALAAVL